MITSHGYGSYSTGNMRICGSLEAILFIEKSMVLWYVVTNYMRLEVDCFGV